MKRFLPLILIGLLNCSSSFHPTNSSEYIKASLEVNKSASIASLIDTSVNWKASMQQDIERHMYAFSVREDGKMRGFNKANAFAAEVQGGRC